MRTLFITLATLAALASPVLAVGPTPAPGVGVLEAEDHTLTVSATPAVGTTAGELTIAISPKGPWKWNPEYPAKLEVVADGITVSRPLLSKKDGDFKVDGKNVKALTTFTASTPGARKATLKGKFGLCDANVCIIKKVETTALVQAR